jgi:SAM-dependent methyltransferase
MMIRSFLHALKLRLRTQIRRMGFDIVRYRARPQWPEDTDRFAYQERFNRFRIAPRSTVLDIGNGGYPFPYATILGDRYLASSPHRTEELIRDHRPFVVMDVQQLPFRNKSIDFVYCSHILEHVDDPMRACSEIMRVGRGGYIETPTFAKDVLFGWAGRSQHKWHVVNINDSLIFFQYTDRQRDGARSSAWKDLILGPDFHPLQDLFYDNADVFNVMFTWKERFECVVYRINDGASPCSTDDLSDPPAVHSKDAVPDAK